MLPDQFLPRSGRSNFPRIDYKTGKPVEQVTQTFHYTSTNHILTISQIIYSFLSPQNSTPS